MKTINLVIAVLVVLSSSFTTKAQDTHQTDAELMKVFQEKVEQWKEAYNSPSAQNLVPLYDKNAKYISSHVEGLEAIGRDKVISNFQNGMTGGGHLDSIEIMQMESSCEMATLLCKYQATNSGITFVGRNIIVMKKVDNNWLIVLHMTVV